MVHNPTALRFVRVAYIFENVSYHDGGTLRFIIDHSGHGDISLDAMRTIRDDENLTHRPVIANTPTERTFTRKHF